MIEFPFFFPDSLRLIDLRSVALGGLCWVNVTSAVVRSRQVVATAYVWGGGPGRQPPMLQTAFPSVSVSDGKCCVFLTLEAQSSENRRVWELFSVKEEVPPSSPALLTSYRRVNVYSCHWRKDLRVCVTSDISERSSFKITALLHGCQ